MSSKQEFFSLLVFGYIRSEIESEYNGMEIPNEIRLIILMFYPKIFGASLYDRSKFAIQKGTDIRAIEQTDQEDACNGFMIYINSLNGYQTGIHYLTVKYTEMYWSTQGGCFRSIGITNLKNEKFTSSQGGGWQDIGKEGNYYCSYEKWGWKETITVKLNCNEWNVSYFNVSNPKSFKKISQEPIKQNEKYFFALCLCGRKASHFQILETPYDIDNL